VTRKPSLKRRTTLTLPTESLRQAQKIATQRHVNLSTVIAEVVSSGLELENAKQRRNQTLENYRKAFAGFSPDELAILDGIILEPPRGDRRR
jgi:hypothetical protein